jgi:23S rRNA pseudouridine2605 synthase
LIVQGRVTVNGRIVNQLGAKVDPAHDEIRVDGELVRGAAQPVYLLFNKPRGILSTMEDPRGRRAIGDLVSFPARLFPVGRLDIDSEGLILLTDDGELANLLTHPRYGHDKEYRVLVNGHPSPKTLDTWRRGVVVDDETTAPAEVELLQREKDSSWLRIVMHEGRKRQIRRVAALLGHPVRELKRVRLGPLHLGTLEAGQWRYLTAREIGDLQAIKRQAAAKSKGRARKRKASKAHPRPGKPVGRGDKV